MDVAMNVDAAITMVHDFTQRALEELVIKGPVANPKDNPEILQVRSAAYWDGKPAVLGI
jgi:hypothetical protein